jgi:MFS family permease
MAAASAAAGGFLSAIFLREGPYGAKSPRFRWNQVGRILLDKEIGLANIGYLGHMWELFAMWAWIPLFLLASFSQQGIEPAWASLAAFLVIAVGGPGSLLAGRLADRFGRTTITMVSLLVSGSVALVIGFLFGGNVVWLTLVALIWGFVVVADSAQFSAAVSELSDREYLGTALTVQTSLGFLLTLFTIRLIPPLVEAFGWRYAFMPLALGPLVGIWAMLRLRRSAGAQKMAGGRG